VAVSIDARATPQAPYAVVCISKGFYSKSAKVFQLLIFVFPDQIYKAHNRNE
jgi:hypothetical protein